MTTSRRELLITGAAAALSYCLPKGVAAAKRDFAPIRAAAAREAVLGADPFLTRSVLSGQLRTPFTVEGQAKRLSLQLVEVGDLASAQTAGTVGSDLSFAALWSGPVGMPLPQQTYRLNHPQLGAFAIFLVPVGRPGKVRYYEAVFNRPEA
ncbi:MAG: hypothetical protein ABW221_18070 [Vicinamibacteria bacterium]